MSLKKVLIGQVGVDSGQLMLIDPCYIDGEWVVDKNDPLTFDQHYEDDEGNCLVAGCHPCSKVYINNLRQTKKSVVIFENYGTPIIEYDGKDANFLIYDEKRFKKIAQKPKNMHLSYSSACSLTKKEGGEMANQIYYGLGHPGLAVVFSSGYGDGCYDVYGYFNKEGRIAKIEVEMMNPEDMDG